jgi:hypothetical protein
MPPSSQPLGPWRGHWGCTVPLRCLFLSLHTDRQPVHRNLGRGRLIFGSILTSPSLSFNRNSLANLGSQPVSKTHTNHSYLAVDTKRSTERLEDPLTWWSAVSCLAVMELCYMQFWAIRGRLWDGEGEILYDMEENTEYVNSRNWNIRCHKKMYICSCVCTV